MLKRNAMMQKDYIEKDGYLVEMVYDNLNTHRSLQRDGITDATRMVSNFMYTDWMRKAHNFDGSR